MSTGKEWLSALQPGDKVVAQSGYGDATCHLLVVERITAKQVVTRHPESGLVTGRYWLDSGDMVGGGWSQMLLEATPERLSTIQRREAARTLAAKKWDSYPLDTLNAVLAVLESK